MERPVDFYKETFDASGFDKIMVPGHIELAGYAQYNPVGSYIKYFDLDKNMCGKRIHICFEGVEEAMYLWLNGQFIGYAEDSFTPSEFDLTPYIKEKGNVLAVQVHKMSTAAFLEDQDFFRFFGIFRNVTLKAIPDVHLEDVWFKPVLNQDNESGSVSVSMKVSATDSQNVTAGFILKDREENILVEKSLQLNKENDHLEGTICVDLESVKLWDNHNPYLYHAYVELKAEDGSLAEVIPYDIGFRRIEIIDKVVYLNGKRLVITGVNRHEWNARTGRCIGIEDMKADISCMLRNNINSVRTCHYPDQIPWYYMCDDAGIYVMAETNLESHGSFQKLGAIEPSCNVPGSIPQWRDAVLERAKNNFETFKNHTSILFWSLGNESYAGDDIEAMNVYFAEKKDGRLVHYESSYYNRAYEDTISDFETRMYAKPEDVEEYLNNSPKKPYILCEFMHDMGNSMGGLGSYMKLIDKYDMYHGGFIWDFIDQAIMVKDSVTGKDVLRYGGDFDDKPSDYEFSANGIVFADRKEKPAMQEVRYYYGLYR
ncbi:MAG: beta-galactosidase [Lachnospira eligens]|nr:MAG: beta-galactosidase [Lachnospira eligens]